MVDTNRLLHSILNTFISLGGGFLGIYLLSLLFHKIEHLDDKSKRKNTNSSLKCRKE